MPSVSRSPRLNSREPATLSVFPGSPADAHVVGWTVANAHDATPEAIWTAWSSATAKIVTWVRVAAEITNASVEALRRKSARDLAAFLSTFPDPELLEWMVTGAAHALPRDPLKRISRLAGLCRSPPVAFVSSDCAAATEVLARLAASAPELPLGIIVSSGAAAGWKQRLSPRTRAMLRHVTAVAADPLRQPADRVRGHRLGVLSGKALRQAEECAAAIASGDEDAARSAAERFLFERLEEAPDTRSLFRLNQKLRVPGASRQLEVDLLSTDLRIAIEIDGHFHFVGPEAYRRDRRKDVALQRAGVWVLRFLATDVVSQLETILQIVSTAVRERSRQKERA